MNRFKSIVILAVGLLSTEIAWKVWNIFIARRKLRNVSTDGENSKKNPAVSEVLMFSEQSQLCRDHANTRIPCGKPSCPVDLLRRIQSQLNAASNTLDVCMYVMTCDDLTKSIVAAHRRAVCVRVIVDSSMAENTACNAQILRLRRAGIKIRLSHSRTTSLMHHKFAIIDRKTILLGSTNWTMQAFYGNYDSILITNADNIVSPYSTEFEKMWLEFQA